MESMDIEFEPAFGLRLLALDSSFVFLRARFTQCSNLSTLEVLHTLQYADELSGVSQALCSDERKLAEQNGESLRHLVYSMSVSITEPDGKLFWATSGHLSFIHVVSLSSSPNSSTGLFES